MWLRQNGSLLLVQFSIPLSTDRTDRDVGFSRGFFPPCLETLPFFQFPLTGCFVQHCLFAQRAIRWSWHREITVNVGQLAVCAAPFFATSFTFFWCGLFLPVLRLSRSNYRDAVLLRCCGWLRKRCAEKRGNISFSPVASFAVR